MEIWKPIPWMEWIEVSSEWNVRKTMKKTKKVDWYEIITISDWKTQKQFFVHRLVASAFLWLDLSDKKTFVCHKDDNPSNNILENLFVWTPADNVKDMIEKWRNVISTKLSEDQVVSIRNKRSEWFSIIKLAKEFNVHKSTISRICNWITW